MQKSELNQGNKPENLYIHIPFCASKCHYCSFISFSGKNELIAPYFSALKKEIKFYSEKFPDVELETIYIGGGTPSVADFCYYREIFGILSNSFKISKNAEITMEINPGTVNLAYLKNIRALGINRLSIGVQSFDDRLLKSINRIYTSGEAEETVKISKEADFENISMDLIYGLPEQTFENWEETLKRAVGLDIQHISAYGLKIEENTEFFRNLPKNLPDEEVQSEMYLRTSEFLEENGFICYEISNYAGKGFESRHNLCYWKNQEYFGLGLSAHGYLNGVRYSNSENLEEYLKSPLKCSSEKSVSDLERIEEGIFLGLRLTEGINTDDFLAQYGVDISKKYSKIIEKYVSYGFMEYGNSTLKLTSQGVLLSNSILAEFLE